MKVTRWVGTLFLVQYLLANRQWYRRWFGGRWEQHYIEPCHSTMWLPMKPNKKWPEWREPCSRGTPTIEDWPLKGEEQIDYSLREGDVVTAKGWELTTLSVVGVNWALKAAAIRLGNSGDIVVWPVSGLVKTGESLKPEKENPVDSAITMIVLPQAYHLIDELMTQFNGQVPKELALRCRKLLPQEYPNGFGYKKPEGK